MTGPDPSGFEYRDDSIVARISVDVPASTLTDLDQVRERATALRTELEAIARAQGDWLGSLQAIPAITEQANQAYRNMITQLERMSYIQGEMGTSGSQPNVGMSGSPMGGQGGSQPYSTAAPAGYVDQFMGMPGTGQGMGMMGAQTYMQSMMMSDPRMFANMAAQRGYPVNPAQLGLVGGAVAGMQGAAPHTGGGMGQGAPTPGAMTSQVTQSSRASASEPNPNEGGAPTNSEHQREPATPHPDTPAWQQTLNSVAGTAGSVLNEVRTATGARGGGLIAGGAAALGAIGRIGGNAGGGGGDDGGGGGGGGGGIGGMMGGNWGRVAAGAGIAAAGVGLGLKANQMVQNAGETIQGYHNLGAEAGGGAVEGAGYEIQARMMAMNPFITLDQSRSIMQSALKNGYTGAEFDTVTGFMAENLKEMNMSSTDSMQNFMNIVEKGNGTLDDFSTAMSSLMGFTGGDGNKMSLSDRISTFTQVGTQLADAGMGGASANRMNTSITNAFSDNQVLKDAMPQATMQGMNSPAFQMAMATANGMEGISDPIQVAMRLEEQGIDEGAALDKTYQYIANMVPKNTDLVTGATQFYRLLQAYGITSLSPAEAKEYYANLVGGNANAFSRGVDQKTAAMNAGQGQGFGKTLGNLAAPLKAIPNMLWGGVKGAFGNTEGAAESVGAAVNNFKVFGDEVGDMFTSDAGIQENANALTAQRGNRQATGPTMVGPGTGYVAPGLEGNVTGTLNVTVDQQGRVSAPQMVNISGQQRQVNSGYGSGTMNNPGVNSAAAHAAPAFSGG